jgi:Tol biopolymer transport system component
VRQVRGLLPYAAFAVFVVGATVVALIVSTLGPTASIPDSATPTPTTVASAVVRPTTDLSPNGRLAYWRLEANGEYQLWLANADNSRRRSVAKADPAAVTRTRWSADGGSIAYVEGGVRLVVVRIDGVTANYTLAPELRADGYRIVDHRFSPSGARIAATVQRATGSQTDVYVSAQGGVWTRLTTTEDVLASEWVSEDELLVQTTGGIVGRLRAAGRDQVRPLTGLPAATPIIGDDGRLYFLSGRVQGFAGSTETLVFAAASSVWSMTANGEELRRENVNIDADSFRLDGQWPGGGFLLHRGTNPGQIALGRTATQPNLILPLDLPTTAGAIERLQVSLDKRFAIGFSGSNLVRVELTATGVPATAVVLLGSVSQGDAWFPRAAALSTTTPAKADVPAARYVFALGGHLWTMGADGAPSLFRAGNTNSQTLRRFAVAPPQWSPAGDKVLTVESLAPGASAFQLIAATIDRAGTVKRYNAPSSIGPLPTWSPDGTQFALVALPAASQDPVVLSSNLTIVALDAATSGVTSTIPGREAFWTKAGLVVLNNGTWRVGDRARDEQSIELWTLGQMRSVTTLSKLIADPRVQAPAQTRGLTLTSGLTAAADGAHAAVHVLFLQQAPPAQAFVMIRTRDGVATAIIAGDNVNDEAWSATSRYIGYTLTTNQAGGVQRRRALVRDAETGDVVLEVDGRFAGWSPDGLWTYIARDDGLYARQVAGGNLVRFSPYGVAVSATKP